MIRVIHFLANLLLFVSISAFAETTKPPLTLVMGEDSYPYQFVDDTGEVQGVLVDLWREWSLQTDTPIRFVPRYWQDSLTLLSQGEADIHLGMAPTEERRQIFDFAEPISSVSTYLYLRQSLGNKSSIKELQPYRIGVVTGSSHESILSEQNTGLSFRYYPSRMALLEGVNRGDVDIFAGMEGYLRDNAVSRAVLDAFPVANRLLIHKVNMQPAVIKGDRALLAKINQGFSLVSDDVKQKIEKHWLGYSKDTNTLIITTTTGIQPFVDIGGDGEPQGMYIDIWKLWSKKTGINVEFKPNAMAETLEDLKYGRADIQVGYPESNTIKTGYHRAWRIAQVTSRIFSYKAPVKQKDDFAGERIGVMPTAPYLSKLKAALPESELKFYTDVTEMIAAAKAGYISAFVASSAWTQHHLLTSGNWSDFYPFLDLTFVTDIYGLTRNQDTGLAKRIASGFNLISQDELANIERKWILNSEDRTVNVERAPLMLTAEQTDYLSQLKPLKIGYLKDWRPMEYQGAEGQFQGINSEMISRFAKELGLKFEPVAFDEWNELLDALKKGRVDIVGSVAQTASREKELLFTQFYWPSPWGLVTDRSELSIFNLSQLRGKRLAVVAGYHLNTRLMDHIQGIELVLVPNFRAGIDAVSQGNADGFLEKVVNLSVELSEPHYRDLKMSVLADFSSEQSHFALNPALTRLVPILDKVIAQISMEDQRQIYQHWITKNEPAKWAFITWKQSFFTLAFCFLLTLILLPYLILKKRDKKRQQLEQQLALLGKFDPHTGLPNRSLLDDRLEQTVLMHRREMSPFAVLFICFDNLREVNQSLGHGAGLEALRLGADKLKNSVRKSDTLARFGENEFVLVLNRCKNLDQVCQVADSIIAGFGAPFVIDGVDVSLSVSIGIAMYPNDGDNVVEILKTADQLMSRAIKQGGLCYRCA
ncbi:transporter substrate-binding domain-containing protein [Shewanella sp. AS1]|uniref:transporter substrate-binding domain-containing protein n=1 Tax=Shewanella sp. AS1 TaxID=2907626 RepID=UPI001F38C4D1|nr:transporter substrate-binding domain-containing protein [Shewanella sp. AS1]MCE9678792.1 transporter substrate-binding domain-containing protein [Shewanella sp. AS1]